MLLEAFKRETVAKYADIIEHGGSVTYDTFLQQTIDDEQHYGEDGQPTS